MKTLNMILIIICLFIGFTCIMVLLIVPMTFSQAMFTATCGIGWCGLGILGTNIYLRDV